VIGEARPGAWLPRPRPGPAARVALFCFPHAGGGASAFAAWPAVLSPSVEVRPVQLPGRESRFRERPLGRMEDLVGAAVPALAASVDRPFALFGLSLGAAVAYAVAAGMERAGLHPLRLLVAAHRAPSVPPREEVRGLPSDELWAWLARLNGTSAAVLEDGELRDVLEPVMRADLELDETYRPDPPSRLACPITVLGGDRDDSVTEAELTAWEALTSGGCEQVRLPGDHFSLYEPAQLPARIAGVLARELAPA